MINRDGEADPIILKYFVTGHTTYMPAGAFHRKEENEMKEMGKVCDFLDSVRCVQRAGDDVIMEMEDFNKCECF